MNIEDFRKRIDGVAHQERADAISAKVDAERAMLETDNKGIRILLQIATAASRISDFPSSIPLANGITAQVFDGAWRLGSKDHKAIPDLLPFCADKPVLAALDIDDTPAANKAVKSLFAWTKDEVGALIDKLHWKLPGHTVHALYGMGEEFWWGQDLQGDEEAFQAIVAAVKALGHDINAAPAPGVPPAIIRMASDHLGTTNADLDALVDAGADLELVHEGRTPLETALHHESLVAALRLVEHYGVAVDQHFSNGRLPLSQIAHGSFEDDTAAATQVFEALLDAGADIDAEDKDGTTARSQLVEVASTHPLDYDDVGRMYYVQTIESINAVVARKAPAAAPAI